MRVSTYIMMIYVSIYMWMDGCLLPPQRLCAERKQESGARHVTSQWEQGNSNTLYLDDTQNCAHPSAKHFLSQADS